MRRLIALALFAACTGCLSICRVPFPVKEYFSDDGVCTNRVWGSIRSMYREKNPEWRGWQTVFPCSVQMRYFVTKQTYFDALTPEDIEALSGEQKYRRKWVKRLGWIPLTVIWLTSPLDAVWDIVCLPWDVLED